jgi:hypothetical protein
MITDCVSSSSRPLAGLTMTELKPFTELRFGLPQAFDASKDCRDLWVRQAQAIAGALTGM